VVWNGEGWQSGGLKQGKQLCVAAARTPRNSQASPDQNAGVKRLRYARRAEQI